MPGDLPDRKPRSWTARVLAPLFIIAVVAAIVLIVSGSMSDDDGDSKQDRKTQTTAGGCKPQVDVEDGYYVVGEGENFTTISDRTCVSIDRLQELNPNLDQFGLQPQNCVDLIPDGCKALAQG